MKNLIVAVLLAVSIPAAAESPHEFCKALSSTAGSIMDARQAGVLMSDLIDSAIELGTLEMTEGIITAAYEEPQWSTERNQRKAVAEFENAVMLECLKATNRRNAL